MSQSSHSYLIIQTAFIGDVILATALIERLHHTHPDASIDVLVRKGNESLLEAHPLIRTVLIWDKKNNKYPNLFRLLRQIRRNHYSHVINLQRFAASGLLTAFSGAHERIGFASNPWAFRFTRRVQHIIGTAEQAGPHEVERNLSLISHLAAVGPSKPRLYLSERVEASVLSYAERPYITISPASVWFTKQLPAEVWIRFLRALPGQRVYLLGAPGDAKLCEKIASESAPADVVVLAGKLSLLASAALMRGAVMNYTNDSAPLHLCSAVNAPVTAVYCSTIPAFGFGPLSEKSHVVEVPEALDCRPCGLHGHASCPKGHFRCADINIQDLLATLHA